MATRGLIDSTIDSFWKTARTSGRPTTPQDLLRRNQPQLSARRTLTNSMTSGVPTPRTQAVASSSRHGATLRCKSQDPTVQALETREDFQRVQLQLRGREGYNAMGVNGVWAFWRVHNGRLAFARDVELQVPASNLQVTSDSAEHNTSLEIEDQLSSEQQAKVKLRFFLFYLEQLDTWVISDSVGRSGSVIADCGPVGRNCQDLDQYWRIWDGQQWTEDRNVVAEVQMGGPMPLGLQGLRVVPKLPLRSRASSQEPRARGKLLQEPQISSARSSIPESARTVRSACH